MATSLHLYTIIVYALQVFHILQKVSAMLSIANQGWWYTQQCCTYLQLSKALSPASHSLPIELHHWFYCTEALRHHLGELYPSTTELIPAKRPWIISANLPFLTLPITSLRIHHVSARPEKIKFLARVVPEPSFKHRGYPCPWDAWHVSLDGVQGLSLTKC